MQAHALFLMLALASGVASYLCSRGPDGEVTLTFILFSVIAVVYVAAAVWFGLSIPAVLLWGVITLACVCVPFLIPPKLDGMAGMLMFIIPACAAAGPVLSVLVAIGRRLFAAGD